MVCAFIILNREPSVSFDMWVHLAQAYKIEVLIVCNRSGVPNITARHTPRGTPRIEEALGIEDAFQRRPYFKWVFAEPYREFNGDEAVRLQEYTHPESQVVYAFGSDTNAPPDHRDFFHGKGADFIYIEPPLAEKQLFAIHAASAVFYERGNNGG